MNIPYQVLFEKTRQQIFDDIYNYTDITLKNNVRLAIMNNGKSIQGMIYNNVVTALLPDWINHYYLFICDNIAISNLLKDETKWSNLEDVLNTHKVNADLVTGSNLMLPKSMIYGHVTKNGNTIFAIDSKCFNSFKCDPEVYLVINVDTDLVGERSLISSIGGMNISNVLTKFSLWENKAQCLGFINGYFYDPSVFATKMKATDYCELYTDENIKFSFKVDLTNRNIYLSSEENLYKDLIIIPRELLLNNVYTYDTVTLVVLDKDGRGVYLPFLASDSISQLTHGIFSISSFLIDAAFDKLGVTDGDLLVIVSNYSKGNSLVMNGSLTEEMYSLTDNQLMLALRGELEPEVDYWKADAMEKRVYGKYLTDISEMDNYNEALIKKQIECLGYYSFTKEICQHTGEIKDLGTKLSNVSITLPLFWKEANIFPLLYLDGNLLDPQLYQVVYNGTTLEVTFGVPYPVDFSYSILAYDLMVLPLKRNYRCIVSGSTQGITIPKDDKLRIFHKVTENTHGITEDVYPGYEELTLGDTVYYHAIVNPTEYIFAFKDYAQNHEFVFTYDTNTLINNHPNINLSSGATLYFTPTTNLTDSAEVINELGSGDYEVFLNGRYLVEGIDYCVGSLNGVTEGVFGGYQIVIQNLKFLKESNNSVMVVKSNKVKLTQDTGYIVDGIIPRNKNNEAWIEGISKLYINGKLVPFDKVTKKNTHYEIDSSYCGNGYIYQMINAISQDFYDAYSPYQDPEYFTGRKEVTNFFISGYDYQYPQEIVINYGNKIFSSYLNEVIKRIVAGTITVNYINDDSDIIKQLEEYEYLKRYDVIFKEGSYLDKKFVDFYPGYLATVSISDLNHYLYIQRLVKIYLGADNITDHQVVYTGS